MTVEQDSASAPGAEEHKPNPELLKLAREARGIDGAAAAEAAVNPATALAKSAAATNLGELQAVLTMARGALLPLVAMLDERKGILLAGIWTDDTIKAIAESGAEVLALHGIRLTGSGFGPYAGLALALGPAAFGTYKVLTHKFPEQEASGGQQQ